jgi:glutathionylspermidine synthase
MMEEAFGPHALATYKQMQWIEPIWKMLLSNKGILPILWELHPGHPNLLPAYFATSGAPGMQDYASKPLHSREGANISLIRGGQAVASTGGPYGGALVLQELGPETSFQDASGTKRHPVVGLWMIDQECGGMGVRESTGPITDNLSSFVPHYFL